MFTKKHDLSKRTDVVVLIYVNVNITISKTQLYHRCSKTQKYTS